MKALRMWALAAIAVLAVLFVFGMDPIWRALAQPEGFWSPEVIKLTAVLGLAFLAMVVLPIAFHFVDEQLGVFFLLVGGGLLWVATRLSIVKYDHGEFHQLKMHTGHPEGIAHMLKEPILIVCFFFFISLFALKFKNQIEGCIRWLNHRLPAWLIVGIATFVLGMFASISIVAVATVAGVFFKVMQLVTKRNYNISVILCSGALGIGALLTTLGEPLSLFIAKNLGVGSEYLFKTYFGMALVNVLVLAVSSGFFASRAPEIEETATQALQSRLAEARYETEKDQSRRNEALKSMERYDEQEPEWNHQVDALLWNSFKLYLFVFGLLLLGEAVKPIAAHIFGDMHPYLAFWVNALSAVADNALLGLLEVQKGMEQGTVLILGMSLALMGVALPPGNVCNIVLKEKLSISFKDWGKYGIVTAFGLAVFNFILILTGIAEMLIIGA